MKTIIKLKYYTLAATSDKDEAPYKIINNQFNIIESEVGILPQAIKYLTELEGALQAQYDMLQDNASKTTLN